MSPLISPLRRGCFSALREPDSAAGWRAASSSHGTVSTITCARWRREGSSSSPRPPPPRPHRRRLRPPRGVPRQPRAPRGSRGHPGQRSDRFSSLYLVALASQLVGDVATLRAGAERAQEAATLALEVTVRFRSAAERAPSPRSSPPPSRARRALPTPRRRGRAHRSDRRTPAGAPHEQAHPLARTSPT